jgi:hypothetical protein
MKPVAVIRAQTFYFLGELFTLDNPAKRSNRGYKHMGQTVIGYMISTIFC